MPKYTIDSNAHLRNKYILFPGSNRMPNTVLLIEPRLLPHIPRILAEYHRFLQDTWKYVFYCGKGTREYWKDLVDPYVELRELHTINFETASEYSYFMKQSTLWESLYGEFVLTIQADTWIMNIEPYTIDFFLQMNKSYIGGNMLSVWNEHNREGLFFPYYNFNGGLSLRKRTHMIQVIHAFPPRCLEKGIIWSQAIETDPEDVYFTTGCHRLGFPLGDDEACSHFAIHKIMHTAYFGIHQPEQNIRGHLHLPSFL
jgi:hypothetical protein